MTDHDAIAAQVRLMSEVCECDTDYCRHAEAHDDAPDYDGISAAYLDLYDEVQRLRAERDRLRTQCCMCGKTGLSIIEDGGPECELDDGRWVCSVDCYDLAVLNHLVAEAERDGLRAALLIIAEYLPSFDYVARDEFGKCTDLPGSPYDRGKADASAHLSAVARTALRGE